MTLDGRRILVVEDEFLLSLVTVDVLEGVGCIVVGPAARVAAALDLIRSEPLDGAVLDVNVAGEMVWPVAEELQRRSVPFLFVSGYASQDVIPVQFASILHLGKPVDEHRLLQGLGAM